jgi:hypothetical protein
MSARTTTESTLDAGYLSSKRILNSQNIDQFLAFVGESIYGMLDTSMAINYPQGLSKVRR